MRTVISMLLCALSLGAAKTFAAENTQPKYKMDDYRNYYGSWAATSPKESLQFCKNMGYRYVLYMNGMENFRESDGLWFVMETPEYMTYNRTLDTAKKYSKKQIAEWEKLCAQKDANAPFPYNMASGWFWDIWAATVSGVAKQPYTSFSLQLNFQKKEVIDATVKKIMDRAGAIVKKNPNFKLGGFSWDVPDPTGDFYGISPDWKKPRQVGLKFWTGKDSVSTREGQKLDYSTYSEGTLRYLMALRQAARKLNPEAKFIIDPWYIYRDYVKHIEDGNFKTPEFADAMPDLIMSESPSEEFATDKRNFASGVIDPSRVSTSSDLSSYDFAREVRNIGIAASTGAWSNWFGNPCPTMKSIRDVPARMKISRALATWENLNNTPLAQRKWDGKVYDSPTAHIDMDCVWATHPETKRIFFSLLSPDAEIKIPDGMEVEKIHVLDSVFGEYQWARLDKIFDISGGKIRLKDGAKYVCGEGFSARLKKKAQQ